MAPPRGPTTRWGLVGKFFGNTVSEAAAFAAGVAIGPVLGPPTQALRNTVNSKYPLVPPPYMELASGVAQGQVDYGASLTWASQQGIGQEQFDALVAIADSGPGVAQAFELWRRGEIGDGEFRTALKRAAIEDQWIVPLMALKRQLLSPAELANAVVQGFRTEAEAAKDAALQGYDAADFQTMVDVTGLPPGPETLQDWVRRGVISEAELEQGIREGHTKVKYIPFYRATLQRVLGATTYAGLFLRGWITRAEMNTGGALTGYSPEDMDRLYLDRGRPATTHQVHIGFARGGRLAGTGNDERATFKKAVQESDIRPEWEPILWAQRYTYPAAFVLRALTQSGDITEAQAHEILLFEGWEPTLAATVAAKWAGGGTAAAAVDPEVKKAQSSLFTAAHRSYVARESDATAVRPSFTALGIDAAAQASILSLWDTERALIHAELSPTAIKKAVKGAVLNPATGQPWTTSDALTALLARGYSQADATTLIEEY